MASLNVNVNEIRNVNKNEVSSIINGLILSEIKVAGHPGLKCKSEGRKVNGEEEVNIPRT